MLSVLNPPLKPAEDICLCLHRAYTLADNDLMNVPGREAHYSDPKNASIKSVYRNAHRVLLGKEDHITPEIVEGKLSIGVAMNHTDNPNARQSRWLNLTLESRSGDRHLWVPELLRIEAIDPREIRLGKTALIETVVLTPGDTVNFGSARYPLFAPDIAEVNARVRFREVSPLLDRAYAHLGLRQDVNIVSRDSTNGTTVFLHGDATYTALGRHHFTNAHREEWMNGFYSRRDGRTSGPQPSREPGEYELDDTVATECAAIYAEFPDDKKAGLRRFEKMFHPDRNRHLDATASHERYVRGRRLDE